MKKFAVVIEEGPNNYSAHVPDLPGCVSTGWTLAEIERNIREAIEYHIEGMIEDGDPIPEPSSKAIEVEVSVT
jgi:predicted RNase H-like HicB family nuclease